MWNANEVANWFLVRHSSEMQRDEAVDENLTQMKLHKLMYYAQGVFLALFSQRLFDEELLAWKHGSVVRSIYDRFQGQKELDTDINMDQMEDYENIALDDNSRMTLEAVYEQFASFSAGQLRNMTHDETPWKEAWAKGEGTSPIDDNTIEEYFKDNIVESSV
ncbi:DUF4065 domain-containing protein [Enterococcus gallinarum]|nr:DUF4065 domain-containing protein [Enterococcus gallinarum]